MGSTPSRSTSTPADARPGDDRSLEELPGNARVPAHHGDGAMPRELSAVGQDMRGGNGKAQGQLRGQLTVRQAPDPVRAE